MSRLMTWKNVEELGSVVHSKREDQPIRFSSSKRGLGCGCGGVPIAHRQVSEASEQMRFNECECGKVGRGLTHISEYVQRFGRVSLGYAHNGTRDVYDVRRVALGGESAERCARLIYHPEASLRGRE